MKWCSFGNLNITWHKTNLRCHMGVSHYSIFQVHRHNLGAVNKVALKVLLRIIIEFALMVIIIHWLNKYFYISDWLKFFWLILHNQIWKMSVISWTWRQIVQGNCQKKGWQTRSPGDKVAMFCRLVGNGIWHFTHFMKKK